MLRHIFIIMRQAFFIVMTSVITLSVIIPGVVALSVIMLGAVMLNIVMLGVLCFIM
jgi:hypothetical protein